MFCKAIKELQAGLLRSHYVQSSFVDSPPRVFAGKSEKLSRADLRLHFHAGKTENFPKASKEFWVRLARLSSSCVDLRLYFIQCR